MLRSFLTRLRLGPSPYKASKYTVGLDPAVPPLYQRVPSFWARWTWTLIACDIFMAGSAIELTWNNWTTLITDDRPSPSPSDPNAAPLDPPRVPDHYGLRPAWQRASMCLVHLAIGTGAGVFLAIAQSRYVRMMSVVPPPVKEALVGGGGGGGGVKKGLPKTTTNSPGGSATAAIASHTGRQSGAGAGARLFIQCAHNYKTHGLSFPLSACTLKQGRDHSELTMRVAGERGHWYVPLDEAWVGGLKVGGAGAGNTLAAREQVLREWTRWGGRKEGVWARPSVGAGMGMGEGDGRWKSGPAARRV